MLSGIEVGVKDWVGVSDGVWEWETLTAWSEISVVKDGAGGLGLGEGLMGCIVSAISDSEVDPGVGILPAG